jgi:phage head maturation protease
MIVTRNAAGALERRAIPIDIRAVGEDGTFTGYASRFGEQDSYGDVVMPGAFQPSIQASGARGVKLLWQHDTARPIGVWTDLREDVAVPAIEFLHAQRTRRVAPHEAGVTRRRAQAWGLPRPGRVARADRSACAPPPQPKPP